MDRFVQHSVKKKEICFIAEIMNKETHLGPTDNTSHCEEMQHTGGMVGAALCLNVNCIGTLGLCKTVGQTELASFRRMSECFPKGLQSRGDTI